MSFLCIAGLVDGGYAYGGVYRFHETTGTPLSVIVEEVTRKGGVVALDEYLREAQAAGMSGDRAAQKLAEAFSDSLGAEHAGQVALRLRVLLKYRRVAAA